MTKFLIPIAIALGALALAPRSPASQADPTPAPPKVTWNVEPVGMAQPHPPVDIFYNPFPRGTGRREWAQQLQSAPD